LRRIGVRFTLHNNTLSTKHCKQPDSIFQQSWTKLMASLTQFIMAAEHSAGSVNGFAAGPPASITTPGQSPEHEVSKEQIGWYFVERYYNTLSKNPAMLYLLYNKRSQFVVGVEEEKVQVCIGLKVWWQALERIETTRNWFSKAINDRVKELNYQNCKVRVNNVDSQSSDVNIVVQVLGEMSNDSQPHRKFVQTFVLAPQPQGYFLLNDILRFFIEEDEQPFDGPEESQPAAETASASVEDEAKDEAVLDSAEHTAAAAAAALEVAVEVDEKVEEVAKAEEAEPVNGTSPEADAAEESETVAPAEPSSAGAEDAETSTAKLAEEDALDEESPVTPTTTPAEPQTAPKPAPAQTKPAVPMSWAQRAAASAAAAAAAANPRAAAAAAPSPAATSTATSIQPKATSPVAPSSNSTQAAPAVAPTAAPAAVPSSSPARQPSPVDSNQDGSTGGWQTAGADHSRNKSRSQPGPSLTEHGHVRAYVKNVYHTVNADELKSVLSQYGELAYFDISRQKVRLICRVRSILWLLTFHQNSAFVEYKTLAGFQAAVQNNPHKIGADNIYVEERRSPAFSPRGGARGGIRDGARGGGRAGGSYGPGKNDGGAPRGGFTGNRGRGAPNMVASRGRPQQV
jgi:hypothetical protein